MIEVLSCIAFEHNYYLLAVAILISAIGSTVTMRLFGRTRNNSGSKRLYWIFISGVTGGCTIWTTHFVAMVGYNTPFAHAFEPVMTVASLFLSVAICILGFAIACSTRKSFLIEVGGGVVGAGIVAMHYLGMQAFVVAGRLSWDTNLVVASVIFGIFFGAVAFNRAARPLTRYCRYFGPVSLSLAIETMHFTAMGALTITADPMVYVPNSMLSDPFLVLSVVGLMVLVLGSSFSINILDNKQKAETAEYFNHLSQHDALTGLPHFETLIQQHGNWITDAENRAVKVTVIQIEIEGLREIRNVHGQAVSDNVLKTMAGRLSDVITKGEFLARGRGDTLVVLMTTVRNQKQVYNFLNLIEAEFNLPYSDHERNFAIGFRCGIALHPVETTSPRELLGHSELALARAEQSKTQRIVFYDPKIDEGNRSRSALSMELRHAIERDELQLFYQPQIDVPSGNLIGFEVLLRWFHPERGLVSPDEFIPIAEETGLIIPIGEWVLRTACVEAAKWKNPYKIAVNVATAQLSTGDLPMIILDILGKTGLSAKRLELEITETSIIEDHHHTLNIVRQLKHLGISIAMDDFGTGYSSLSMLQTFPFDKIKIDRSFISGVSTNEQSSAISRATIVLADGLHMKTLAEGVEDEDDLEFLRQNGCQEAQGYYFGKPVPLADILSLVNADLSESTENEPQKVFQLARTAY